ncbi:retrovirus-related pol polyprotein from [Plakobranchus ocellatus]|uniref:Retrovirus-related pol polyprotein from n=1 Tax=Plakobranchus ocellatus TaxID=259542 RepID=A0AAV4CMM8_9GAST|nr:retrovirus-related pol polyprotein from [Plakobranchus ocellatus]
MVDASPHGLGAMLIQEGREVSYASRSLTYVESRYSQTEREILAVVFGVEKFHIYLYGSTFTVITDHKPLLGIIGSCKPTLVRIDR